MTLVHADLIVHTRYKCLRLTVHVNMKGGKQVNPQCYFRIYKIICFLPWGVDRNFQKQISFINLKL